jgi:hypothetical protein
LARSPLNRIVVGGNQPLLFLFINVPSPNRWGRTGQAFLRQAFLRQAFLRQAFLPIESNCCRWKFCGIYLFL